MPSFSLHWNVIYLPPSRCFIVIEKLCIQVARKYKMQDYVPTKTPMEEGLKIWEQKKHIAFIIKAW
jgi:hypothetical protein